MPRCPRAVAQLAACPTPATQGRFNATTPILIPLSSRSGWDESSIMIACVRHLACLLLRISLPACNVGITGLPDCWECGILSNISLSLLGEPRKPTPVRLPRRFQYIFSPKVHQTKTYNVYSLQMITTLLDQHVNRILVKLVLADRVANMGVILKSKQPFLPPIMLWFFIHGPIPSPKQIRKSL